MPVDRSPHERRVRAAASASPGAGGVAVSALVLALIAAQAWYSSLTTSRVYYEELAESVRNPFWIAHRLVYDGVSSNVGWYALMAGIYRVFGFSLVAGKVVRASFQAVSLACLAHLVVRWLGWRRALVPIAVIGLSPVVLYFNTLLTTYGIDLQWAPVLVWLLWHSDAGSSGRRVAMHAVLGLSIMMACFMWPVCVFYVPMWMLMYVVRWQTAGRRIHWTAVTAALASAAAPLIVSAAILRNAQSWIHDAGSGSGVFRGGGTGLVDSPRAFAAHVWWMITDITASGTSYYFWLPRPDLSGLLAIVSAATVLMMFPEVCRSGRPIRIVALSCVVFGVGTLALAAAVTGPPGFRRATGCIAAFYAVYLLCWYVATNEARQRPHAWAPRAQIALLSLLLAHHLLVFVSNGRSLTREFPPVERQWFGVAATPQESLEYWARQVEAGNPLDCRRLALPPESCRYPEIYAATASYLRWTVGRPVEIKAYDFATGRYVVISPETWGDRRR